MARIREIFAKNLKENRRKCGFSQEKLAEKAHVSTHYIAMMELTRNFPTSEIIERIAAALNIEIYELFVIAHSPKEEIEKLRSALISDIKQMVEESIESAFAKRDKKAKS